MSDFGYAMLAVVLSLSVCSRFSDCNFLIERNNILIHLK